MTDTVMAANRWATNGHLIADVASLGYLRPDDRILDPTWGHGTWWKQWQPTTGHLFGSDLDPAKSPSAPADFRKLTDWDDGAVDAVAFDPPYKLNGTATPAVDGRYGVDTYAGPAGRHQLICEGLTECTRVTRRTLLVKCQDQVCSGRMWWQTDIVTRHAEALGLVKVDRFDMLGGRPQPAGRRQLHARGRGSTLLVFRKGRS